ncbi:MAG TPA: alpha/beta fold hydrolase [Polyangiaceae bacterium]
MRGTLKNILKILCATAACRAQPVTETATATPSATPTVTVTVSSSATAMASATATATDLVSKRPYRLVEPDAPTGAAMPLVVLLHGYGSSGANHDTYFGLSALTKKRGVLLAIPDGTRDHKGLLFWNATDACCDFDQLPIDDVAYLDALVTDVERRAHVDPARIYVIGHSNGAFMAHAWACEPGSRVAAIVALAGVPWNDAAKCENRGVSVLQVHGDADRVIAFEGGRSFGNGNPYPSADATVAAWAARDGCSGPLRAIGSPVDFDGAVPGAETSESRYTCPIGLDVELWRMHGSGHVPRFDARFAGAALDFLLAHDKKKI